MKVICNSCASLINAGKAFHTFPSFSPVRSGNWLPSQIGIFMEYLVQSLGHHADALYLEAVRKVL